MSDIYYDDPGALEETEQPEEVAPVEEVAQPEEIEIIEDDGRRLAHGTIWKLYFEGQIPSDEQVARALAPFGAVKTQKITDAATARVTPTIKEEQA